MSSHIFISYARKDGSEHANLLDTTLPEYGFNTWRDKRGIDATQDFTAEIEKAIESSSHVVTCITSDVKRDNSFVRREIAYAQILKKPIIVVRFEDIAPPISVITHTWIDFFRGWDEALKHLIDIIRGETKDTNNPQESHINTNDPARLYLENLYSDIVEYLKSTVFSMIDIRSKTSSDLVKKTKSSGELLMRMGFKSREKPDQSEIEIKSLNEGFEKYQGRLLLLGEPGAGKTTLLMAFARDAIIRCLENADAPMPVLLRCPMWDAEENIPLPDWLAENTNILHDEIKKYIQQGKMLLVMDGLDELGNERTEKNSDGSRFSYDPRKRFMANIPTNNQIIVSCRISDYEEIGEKIALNGAITLLQLSNEQIQDYLRDLPELWAAIHADEILLEVARTPLLLSLFTFAFQEAPHELKKLSNLNTGDLRDTIFRQYIYERYAHEEERVGLIDGKLPFTLTEIYETLGQIAMKDYFNFFHGDNLKNFEEDRRTSFINFMQLLNLVIPIEHFDKSQEKNYRFIHWLLKDYFQFEYSKLHLEDISLYEDRSYYGYYPTIVLGRQKDERALPDLIGALNNQNEIIRRTAGSAIVEFGEIALHPLLQTISNTLDTNLTPLSLMTGNEKLLTLFSLLGKLIYTDTKNFDKYHSLLTTYFTPEIVEALLYWQKVLDNNHFETMDGLSHILRFFNIPASLQEIKPPESRTKKLILIIDDGKDNVDFLCEYVFEPISHLVSVIATGSGVVGLVLSTLLLPDLIITDLEHYHLRGDDNIRYFRKNVITSKIPIICSSFRLNSDVDHSVESIMLLGATACVEKPYYPEEMSHKVQEVLFGKILVEYPV